jgi:hypothetical protein
MHISCCLHSVSVFRNKLQTWKLLDCPGCRVRYSVVTFIIIFTLSNQDHGAICCKLAGKSASLLAAASARFLRLTAPFLPSLVQCILLKAIVTQPVSINSLHGTRTFNMACTRQFITLFTKHCEDPHISFVKQQKSFHIKVVDLRKMYT